MNKQHLGLVTVAACCVHSSVVPAESFLSRIIPKIIKSYVPTEDPDRSIHMKATDFVMKTIANPDIEKILVTIKNNEKKQATNFFEEAKKLQAVLARTKNPEILRSKSLSSLYKGSAFSIVVEREQDTLHMHTQITTNQKVPYRLEDDSHTQVYAEYRQFDEGWETISYCETSIPWQEAVSRIHEINDKK